MRYDTKNSYSVNVFQSRTTGGWNWNVLRDGKVVAGDIGYATESAAYAAAMAREVK